MTHLQIDIAINAAQWPSEGQLQNIAETAITQTAKDADLRWHKDAELSILFTSDEEVHQLNAKWRSIDKPTNVLSFPSEELKIGETAGLMIGDIILAYETIEREAKEQRIKFDDHLSHLIVHGFLHLFGYDHLNDTDASQMENLEIAILSKLNIDDPYKIIEE